MDGQRITTPFKLPKGARKKVLPAIYLTENYAPAVLAQTRPSTENPTAQMPTVEAVGGEEDGARVPEGRRLNIDDPLLVESTDVLGAEGISTRKPYSQPFVNERRTRITPNWTKSAFNVHPTQDRYHEKVYEAFNEKGRHAAEEETKEQLEDVIETPSVPTSPERYRSDSAGPFRYQSPSTSPSGSPTHPDSFGSYHRNFSKSNEKTVYPQSHQRGRTMYRTAHYYDNLLKKRLNAPRPEKNIPHGRYPEIPASPAAPSVKAESLLDLVNTEDPFRLGASRTQMPTASLSASISISSEDIDTAACDERLAKVIDSFRPFHEPPPDKLEVTSTQHRGIHESHLHLIPQDIQDLLMSGNRQDLINRGPAIYGPQYDRNVTREVFNRDPNAPILANENWDLPGIPRDPNAPPVYFTNVGPFEADAPEVVDAEQGRSPTPQPHDFQPHRNRNNIGPPPNTAVDFKTTIVRSYKDWGLTDREQAFKYTTRIMLEAEKAKHEGVIIPGLEESMKPLHHVDKPRRHVIYEEPTMLKRLDVAVYQFPDNVSLSEVSFALQNTGSMQWIRYDKNENAAHCRFIHEWSARQFATGKSVFTAPLPSGQDIELRIRFPPASIDQGRDSDWLPDMTRRVKFGPIDLNIFREFATEVEDVDINQEDDAQVMAVLVQACVDEDDVYHAVKFEQNLSGYVTCSIEFGEIRQSIKFLDGLKALNLVNNNSICFDRDPCQGFTELKMLNDKRTAERERCRSSSRFAPTGGSCPAREYSTSEHSGAEVNSDPRARGAALSRNAVPNGVRSKYTSHVSSRTTSRDRGKGRDAPTDYERDMMRRRELIALQLAAQDQIKDTYNSGGMRAVNSVFGNRLTGVNLPPGLRKPTPRRGF